MPDQEDQFEKRFHQFVALGEEKFSLIQRMLERGDSLTKVTTFIREDLKAMLDVSFSAVRKRVYTLKKYGTEELLRRMRSAGTIDVVTGAVKRLNAHDELMNLCQMQATRVAAMREREMKAPMLMKVMSDEIRLFSEMLDRLSKVQLEMGFLPRAPKKIIGSADLPGINPDDDRRKVTFEYTEEFERALQVLEEASLESAAG